MYVYMYVIREEDRSHPFAIPASISNARCSLNFPGAALVAAAEARRLVWRGEVMRCDVICLFCIFGSWSALSLYLSLFVGIGVGVGVG